MLHVDVDKLVSQEPPHLVSPGGVIDEEGADRRLAREHGVCHQVRDQVAVGDVENDLELRMVVILYYENLISDYL